MTEIEYELYHHGVKGMKWGHRKQKNQSVSTGVKKSKKSTDNPNRKREIAIAAGAAVSTALAAYGTYKVVNAIKNKDFKRRMDSAMRAVDVWAERGRLDIGMSQIKDVYSTHGDGIGAVIKRTISNNEVNGKVKWGAVAKRLSPL